MKTSNKNTFKDLKKRIIAILASNALKAATLTPLVISMVACDMSSVNKVENPQQPGQTNPPDEQKPNPNPDVPNPPTPSTPVLSSVSAQFTDEATAERKVDDTINLLDIVEFKFVYDEANKKSSEVIKKFADITDTINVTISDSHDFQYDVNNDNAKTSMDYQFKTGANAFTVSGNIGGKQLTSITSNTVNVADKEVEGPVRISIEKNKWRVVQLIAGLSEEDVQSGEVSQNITLTAQTIKLLGDISSGSVFSHKTEAGYENKYRQEHTEFTISPDFISKIKNYYYGEDGLKAEQQENLKSIINVYGNKDIFPVTKDTEQPHKLMEYGIVDDGKYYDWNYWIPDEYGNNEYNHIVKAEEVDTYTISGDNIVLDGDFNYNDINLRIDEASRNNVSLNNATFSIDSNTLPETNQDNGEYWGVTPEVVFDMFANLIKADATSDMVSNILISKNNEENKNEYIENNIFSKFKDGKDGLPRFKFSIHAPGRDGATTEEFDEARLDNSAKLLALYKLYEGQESKLDFNIDIRENSRYTYDGKREKGFEGMFAENNEKDNIPNISANTLTYTSKYINNMKNIKITGKYEGSEKEIFTSFTNVIFEGDVSRLKNSYNLGYCQHNGVVYFKDKPYNTNISGINGVLKLGKIKDDKGYVLDNTTFNIAGGNWMRKSVVVDFRGIDLDVIIDYNVDDSSKRILGDSSGVINAFYFNDDTEKKYKDDYEAIYEKFLKKDSYGTGTVNDVFFGNEKFRGDTSDRNYVGHSKTPRTLEEFENYGNEGQFKTSAKSSYTADEFEKLPQNSQYWLNQDDESKNNGLALNTKRFDFSDPEAKKIIFSVLKDREYNA